MEPLSKGYSYEGKVLFNKKTGLFKSLTQWRPDIIDASIYNDILSDEEIFEKIIGFGYEKMKKNLQIFKVRVSVEIVEE